MSTAQNRRHCRKRVEEVFGWKLRNHHIASHMAHSLGLAVSRTPRQFQNFNDVFRFLDRTGVRADAAVVLD